MKHIACILAGFLATNCALTVPQIDEALGGVLGISQVEVVDQTLPLAALVALAAAPSGPAPADINIRESGTTYLNGGTFDFAGRGSGQLPFTIENVGTSPLIVSNVAITNGLNYSVTQPLSSVVAPGGSTTFTAGNFNGAGGSALLTITSSDPDEGTYSITTLQCGC